MASPVIKIKRSAVEGNAPTVAQLELGELALNTYDGKLFTEINDGTVSIVEIGGHLQHLEVSGISTLGTLASANQFTGNITGSVNSSGISTFGNNVHVADNKKILFGASNDLEIFHQTSNGNSIIKETGGGILSLQTNGSQIQLYDTANNTFMAQFVTGGACTFKHGSNIRLQTASAGITVTGNSAISGNVTAVDATFSGDLEVDGTTDLDATSVVGTLTVTGHSELDNLKSVGIATFTNNAIHANIYSTGISTISGFRFPTSDGDEDQALVTDGNGSLSFKTLSGGGGGATGAATTISSGITTATQGQTVFSTPHPHNDGTSTYSCQVFVNGLKFRPQGGGSTKDYTTSSNSTITMEEGLNVGDEVVSVIYFGHTIDEEYFTATQGQVLFPLSGSLSAQKNFRVFVNGTKLRNGDDYGVAAPVTLVVPCAEGAEVEIVCDNAEDKFTATDQQTNFTPTSTDISSDNMQVYVNGLQLFKGIDFSIGSPSVTLTDASGLTVGDEVDVCIRRTA